MGTNVVNCIIHVHINMNGHVFAASPLSTTAVEPTMWSSITPGRGRVGGASANAVVWRVMGRLGGIFGRPNGCQV